MSGADREVKVKFTTEHDGRGADEANKTIDKTKAKAGGFGRLGKAAAGFKGVMERVNSAMAGFGVMAVVAAVMRIVKVFEDAKAAALAAQSAWADKSMADGIKSVADAYDNLKESIAGANASARSRMETLDNLLDAERRLEDAASVRREEDEVAALDPSDPLRQEKEADIRARYGQRRAETAGKRGVEDVDRAAERMEQEIARLTGQVNDLAALRDAFAAREAEYDARAVGKYNALVEVRRSKSLLGSNTYFGKQAKIDAAEKDYEAAAKRAQEAGDQKAVVQKDINGLTAAITALTDRLSAVPVQRAAAAAEGDNAARAAARTAEGAAAGVHEAARRRERDAADLERARGEKAATESRRAAMEEAKAAAAWRAREEERQAGQARAALDAHAANPPPSGSRTRWRETLAALQAAYDREQTEANEAARALEALGEATAKSMQAVNAKASAAASRIKALEARLGRDPHGDGEAQ
jgi:hypothetical protein